jgi:hypothetical protein
VSYILEALRKMERQRRHESGSESWVEDVSSEPEEERSRRSRAGLVIITVSIFFGICGVLAGILLYQESDAPTPKVTAQSRPRPQRAGPIPTDSSPQPDTQQAGAALPQPKGVTLSAIREVQPAPPRPAAVREMEKDAALPPILSDDAGGIRDMDIPKAVQDTVPKDKEGAMEGGAVLLKSDAQLPEKRQEEPAGGRDIDLTRMYRLTSTGEVDDRKYATIESKDYFVGDHFMGMVVSDIRRDRVYLSKEGSSQRYVIIFRY